MYGILFGNYNTLDWGLTLLDIVMSSPVPKTKYIDLPIGNGSIDMTEAIYGDVSYSDREATFVVGLKISLADRTLTQEFITNALHGRRMSIMLPDDPYHYYMGRLSVGPLRLNGTVANMEITAICDPYKYKSALTVVSDTIPGGGTVALSCTNARMRVIPEITVSAAVSIGFGGNSYAIGAGTWKLTDVAFKEGINLVTITGPEGTAYSITYQEGAI